MSHKSAPQTGNVVVVVVVVVWRRTLAVWRRTFAATPGLLTLGERQTGGPSKRGTQVR